MTQQIELISCTEDVLDRLLSASGESMQQWTADFDFDSLGTELETIKKSALYPNLPAYLDQKNRNSLSCLVTLQKIAS